MNSPDNQHQLDFVLELFNNIQKDDLNYIYKGLFTHNITETILNLAESNIVSSNESSKIKKRVYHIMVECLQNITRHQAEDIEITPHKSGIFAIQNKGEKYYITTGNLMKTDEVESLKGKLEMVNSLKPDEIKQHYKLMLRDGHLSEKGGAGLGLIDIARKSGNKLTYDFKKIDSDFSYFYMKTNISNNKNANTFDTKVEQDSLKALKEYHNIILEKKIMLIFNSIFNQDGLMNLVSIVEKQTTGFGSLKRKIFNIMVEMIQNINKHGDCYQDNKIDGLFFISENEKEYFLHSGNYLRNERISEFQNKLNHINSLDENELEDFYNRRLFNFEIDSEKESGLGVIDMRIKSNNLLHYNFHKINGNYSFFTLQTIIPKK